MNNGFKKIDFFLISTPKCCSSTWESLSYEFELFTQIYKMPCLVLLMPECFASLRINAVEKYVWKLNLVKKPRYKQTVRVIYYIYSNVYS